MIYASIDEMRTNLDKLIRTVKDGGQVVITDQNVPVAHFSPPSLPQGKREFGKYKGEFSIGREFFEPLPDDVLANFED